MSKIEPVAWRWKEDGSRWQYGDSLPLTFNRARHSWGQLYSASALAAARREALEEAANVCEDMSGPIEIYNRNYPHYLRCADAIRALIEKEKE